MGHVAVLHLPRTGRSEPREELGIVGFRSVPVGHFVVKNPSTGFHNVCHRG